MASFREWVTRAWRGNQRSTTSPGSISTLIAESYVVDAVRLLLVGIEEDPFLTPSSAPHGAQLFLQAAGRNEVGGPHIIPAAWACLAGIVSLRTERWLRSQMGPALRDLFQSCKVPARLGQYSEDAWLGFEDRVTKHIEAVLVEWGVDSYGIPQFDAEIRRRYAIAHLCESGCAESTIAPQYSLRELSLLKEKLCNGGFNEHVVLWLVGINARLCGFLEAFLDEQLRRIPEEVRKEWNQP